MSLSTVASLASDGPIVRVSFLISIGNQVAFFKRLPAITAYLEAARIQPEFIFVDAGIEAAIARAAGDFCIVHNVDCTHTPEDYRPLLDSLIASEADVVLGSCTLAFRTSLGQTIPLHSNGAGLYDEMLVQFAKRHARIKEVPVATSGRNSQKRIRDRSAAFVSRLRARLFSKAHTDPAADMLVAMSRANRFNRWMAGTIAPWVRGDVLELGAGIGNLTVFLAPRTARYIATDTDREHLCELRSRVNRRTNIEIAVCDFSDPAATSQFHESVDTVICLNVLEHIEKDVESLANIRSYLRAGGVAIILVPQGPQAFGAMDEVLEHKRRYTAEELRNKMAAAGFRVERMITFNRITWPGWYLNSRILRRRTLSRLQLWLFDLLVPIWRRIDDRLPWPATSLIAIGMAKH